MNIWVRHSDFQTEQQELFFSVSGTRTDEIGVFCNLLWGNFKEVSIVKPQLLLHHVNEFEEYELTCVGERALRTKFHKTYNGTVWVCCCSKSEWAIVISDECKVKCSTDVSRHTHRVAGRKNDKTFVTNSDHRTTERKPDDQRDAQTHKWHRWKTCRDDNNNITQQLSPTQLTASMLYSAQYKLWHEPLTSWQALINGLYYCSVAKWLACWTQAQVQIAVATLSGNSLRQTVHTHRASVHQAAKQVAALLRFVRVTAGLAESNNNLPPGLWLTSPAGWLPRTGISSGTLCSTIEYGYR